MTSILVIDDDDQLRKLIKTVLEREGYEVFEAGDGVQALQVSDQQVPDLILCDLYMPRQEGLETIRAFRKRRPEVPLVAMSGGAALTDSTRFLLVAKHFGADALLAKPFEISSLLRVVKEALQSSASP